MVDVREIEEVLHRKDKRPVKVQVREMLSTGSTLLNLACTGSSVGGFVKGKYYFIVGDSSSGKTFLSLTCFAEATRNAAFDGYRLVFDDVEGGAMMDVTQFFGKKVANRMEPPVVDEGGVARHSQTIEEFYANVNDVLDNGPAVYVLDSMDALTSEYERTKTDERVSALRRGTKAKGDYGDGKAKRNSSGIRALLPKLRDTGSILIVLNQTRDNIGGGMFEPRKVRSGGHALTFYATTELWASVGAKIKKTVRGKPRPIGVHSKINVRKNRTTGRDRTVTIPIHYSYGIDDISSCVDYLIDEGRWKTAKNGMIDTGSDLGENVKLHKMKLIKKIESEELELTVRDIVADVWNEIEVECAEERKPRYE